MSTHRCEVVRLHGIEKHQNADTLDVVRVWGFTCCVRSGDFKDGDLAVYIEPDSLVDTTRQEFSFLEGHPRIKCKRLRGVMSQGLLVKAPDGMADGDDAMEALGITHYEPPVKMETGGETASPPTGNFPIYDVENWRKWAHVFDPEEMVVLTEKLHGASIRAVYRDGEMHLGSHREWKRLGTGNMWQRILDQNEWIEEFCREHQDLALYGEAFGSVQSLKYGSKPGQIWVRAFDLLCGNEWLGWWDFVDLLPHEYRVPVLWPMLHHREVIDTMADGSSLIPGACHMREGAVVRPLVERTCQEIGRVQAKIVSNEYLAK